MCVFGTIRLLGVARYVQTRGLEFIGFCILILAAVYIRFTLVYVVYR